MCGRYTLVRLADFLSRIPWIAPPDDAAPASPPRYNVAPTQAVAAVTNARPAKVEFLRWGLVPSWAKDLSVGNRMINARAETLAEKPAFARLLRRRRCLVPADGFYEWRKEAGGRIKTPMYIRMADGHPFAFAGLWDTWRDSSGQTVRSCTIITTTPNELVRSIHDRMPAILREADYERWLQPEAPPDDTPPAAQLEMLRPYPPEEMEAFAVSSSVNNPRTESPLNICPAKDGLWDSPP
ncbi:MAG TPA: SOS response-associated peptidase [Tepidisphaeraceae bacterium]|nr:SOS response-associated peptidase [Tepidisphaeraceae bacterium]